MRFLREAQRLNKVEKIKLERHPLEVWDAVVQTYSKRGIQAINEVPGEYERLKWVGIYPQNQGGNAFMLRIKVPGGVLAPEQAQAIGQIAVEFANGPIPNPHFGNNFLDITTRQDIQMHWIRMENIRDLAQARRGRHDDRPGLRRFSPQRPLLPGLRYRPRRGSQWLPRGPGHLRVLYGE